MLFGGPFFLCPTIFPYSNASEARRFCHEHECPPNWNNANEINCCVYHANIHSCPLGLMVGMQQCIVPCNAIALQCTVDE